MRARLGHPLLQGLAIGVLLSLAVAAGCPAEELKPGDSRVVMAVVGLVILVPVGILTAYAARSAFRLISGRPRLLGVWLVMILLPINVFMVAVTWSEWAFARRHNAEGRSVMGTVLEMHPEDHDRLLVGYTVAGADFRVRTQGPRVARSYQPGEGIRVYYPASAPGQSVCREPRWRPGLAVISYLAGAVLLPVWGIGFLGMLVRWGALRP